MVMEILVYLLLVRVTALLWPFVQHQNNVKYAWYLGLNWAKGPFLAC